MDCLVSITINHQGSYFERCFERSNTFKDAHVLFKVHILVVKSHRIKKEQELDTPSIEKRFAYTFLLQLITYVDQAHEHMLEFGKLKSQYFRVFILHSLIMNHEFLNHMLLFIYF